MYDTCINVPDIMKCCTVNKINFFLRARTYFVDMYTRIHNIYFLYNICDVIVLFLLLKKNNLLFGNTDSNACICWPCKQILVLGI